jgi:hypothetical protein
MYMSDAVLPSLYDLRDSADDPSVRKDALRAIYLHDRIDEDPYRYHNYEPFNYFSEYDYGDEYEDEYESYDSSYEKSFVNRNLQSALVREKSAAPKSA